MDISFISVNFRSVISLERLVSSLVDHFRDKNLQIEFIVVNNDSDEYEQVEALKTRFPKLVTVHSSGNIGFGRANQLGSERAKGNILFFINPDTLFLAGNFLGLIKAFEYHPRAVYGMGLEQSSRKRERWSSGEFPSLWQLFWNNCPLLPAKAPWESTVLCPVDWVSGAALAVRKDFFEALGGFSPDFFLYFEDVDFAHHAKAKGATVAVYPFIRFAHTGGGSAQSTSLQKQHFYASQRRYFEKWRPRYEVCVLDALQHLFRLR